MYKGENIYDSPYVGFSSWIFAVVGCRSKRSTNLPSPLPHTFPFMQEDGMDATSRFADFCKDATCLMSGLHAGVPIISPESHAESCWRRIANFQRGWKSKWEAKQHDSGSYGSDHQKQAQHGHALPRIFFCILLSFHNA
jgi:hypothetical protein